jgi:hypothetical protein
MLFTSLKHVELTVTQEQAMIFDNEEPAVAHRRDSLMKSGVKAQVMNSVLVVHFLGKCDLRLGWKCGHSRSIGEE